MPTGTPTRRLSAYAAVGSLARAANAGLPRNAPVLAPKESDGGTVRFKGELPPEPKGPVDQALDRQIEEYIPNLWKASRAAVDALTANTSAEEAASSEGPRTEIPVNETPYMLPEGGKPPTSPGTFIDIEV